MEKGAHELQRQMHASFACYSPFARNNEDGLDESLHNSATTSTPSMFAFGRHHHNSHPTLLERPLSHRTSRVAQVLGVDMATTLVDCKTTVAEQLQQAYCLQAARRLGVSPQHVRLSSFETNGGAASVARELVAVAAASRTEEAVRADFLTTRVRQFCTEFQTSYDLALLAFAQSQCRRKHVTADKLRELAMVARCCSEAGAKARVAVEVLRSALSCGCSHQQWLSQLADDATIWSTLDAALHSEVVEAARLLRIDRVVLKYCGSGARELFRVEQPRHAIRLMDHVAKHVTGSHVVDDLLSLCSAFAHLAVVHASQLLLENAIQHGDPRVCESIFQLLLSKAPEVCSTVLANLIENMDLRLTEGRRNLELVNAHPALSVAILDRARSDVQCLRQIVKSFISARSAKAVVLDQVDHLLDGCSITEVAEKLCRTEELILRSALLVSFSDGIPTNRVLSMQQTLTLPLLQDYSRLSTTTSSVARRASSLVRYPWNGRFPRLWSMTCTAGALFMTDKASNVFIIDFLRDNGLLHFRSQESSAQFMVVVAIGLCMRALRELEDQPTADVRTVAKNIVRAASLLFDNAFIAASSDEIGRVVSLGGAFEFVCQVFCQLDEGFGEEIGSFRKLLASDNWTGAWNPRRALEPDGFNKKSLRTLLHPSWYVGDGILLAPQQALSSCLQYCEQALHGFLEPCVVPLNRLMKSSGAHNLRLRLIVTCMIGSHAPRDIAHKDSDVADDVKATLSSLAERSLGGTGTGITSGIVDSQLSVAFLVALPVKSAFRLYKSVLPAAIKSNDYDRVLSLANVGKAATQRGGVWGTQLRFSDQCDKLAVKAMWSRTLARNGISLDMVPGLGTNSIGDLNSSISSTYDESPGDNVLSTTMLPILFERLAESTSISKVLRLAHSFAASFALSEESVSSHFIEYLLSPPENNSENFGWTHSDVRSNFQYCEKAAREALSRLSSSFQRLDVMRRCLARLDASEQTAREYDRFSLSLALYHEVLATSAEREESEMDLVDRRRDALEILKSFFAGDRVQYRPSFPALFAQTKTDSSDPASPKKRLCGVLGNCDDSPNCCDPLQHLEAALSLSPALGSAAALAPLGFALGVPPGYVHARNLMLKFKAAGHNSPLPLFESDVDPVLDRLRSHQDKGILAKWCANRFVRDDESRLKCMDVVWNCAVEESQEAEAKCEADGCSAETIDRRDAALETFRSIDIQKRQLSDLVQAKKVLCSERSSDVARLCDQLLEDLELKVSRDETTSPEDLIEFLYSTGSLIGATACLEESEPLAIPALRHFSRVVHNACLAVGELHSHINCGTIVRAIGSRFLFHGDVGSESLKMPEFPSGPEASGYRCFTEDFTQTDNEDTSEFVMDLVDLDETSNERGDGPFGKLPQHSLTNDAEPSSISELSRRERSDRDVHRSALRIAFLMAFPSDRENNVIPPSSKSTRHRGLLAAMEAWKDPREAYVLDVCRELLRIVLAPSEHGEKGHPPSCARMSPRNLFASPNADGLNAGVSNQLSITFGMRHRAFVVASYLCPQEALHRVIDEGNLWPSQRESDGSSKRFSLEDCTFGVFVAKEVESMGLTLPLSDLAKLSTMHFPSYARTLWRDHQDTGLQRSRGCFLLLLLEMAFRDSAGDIDFGFVGLILDEIQQASLPRTQLLALERVSSVLLRQVREGRASSILDDVPVVRDSVMSTAKRVVSELYAFVAARSAAEGAERSSHAASALTLTRSEEAIPSESTVAAAAIPGDTNDDEAWDEAQRTVQRLARVVATWTSTSNARGVAERRLEQQNGTQFAQVLEQFVIWGQGLLPPQGQPTSTTQNLETLLNSVRDSVALVERHIIPLN
jgi:hypothetical protein